MNLINDELINYYVSLCIVKGKKKKKILKIINLVNIFCIFYKFFYWEKKKIGLLMGLIL